MDVTPATMAQVRQGRGGKFVHLDNEVAHALRELDPGLRLRYSESGGYYVVYFVEDRGDKGTKEHLVLTAQECDHRIVARCMFIDSRGYDYGEEIERIDRLAEVEHDRIRREQVGEIGARLHQALRKERGWDKDTIFVGGDAA